MTGGKDGGASCCGCCEKCRCGCRDQNGVVTKQSGLIGGPMKSAEEQSKDALNDLDRLERLLILEHKARVNASLEADRAGILRRTGKDLRPEPFPPGYVAGRQGGTTTPEEEARKGNRGSNFVGDSRYPGALGNGVEPETIREAYELAHRCPVTPPPQCRASHQLQDVLEDIRVVTMDPINPQNRRNLQRLLHAHGRGETPEEIKPESIPDPDLIAPNGEKHTMATLRTSTDHPQGTGVVWRKGLKFGEVVGGDAVTGVPPGECPQCYMEQQQKLRPGAAAAISIRKEEAVGSAEGKKVTYVD